MNVYTVKCKSTNCYLIEASEGYLLFDAGWVNEYGNFRNSLKENNISTKEIKWFIVSHFHIDHAGLAGMLLNNGKEFIVFENQIEQINEMEEFIGRKKYSYTRIDKGKIIWKKINESRDWLKIIGIDGEIIQIFGHGDQSVALILDNRKAFIGDLPVIYEYDELVKNDWDKIISKGVKYIYPAHSESMEIEKIKL
jgi:glyoxylase-like metal-dependent hydrolase (beta-lactamase superfamily II)